MQIRAALSAQLKILVYNGDTDMACNFLMGQKFSESLKLGLKASKREWKYMDQVAGFVTQYEGIDFLTVKVILISNAPHASSVHTSLILRLEYSPQNYENVFPSGEGAIFKGRYYRGFFKSLFSTEIKFLLYRKHFHTILIIFVVGDYIQNFSPPERGYIQGSAAFIVSVTETKFAFGFVGSRAHGTTMASRSCTFDDSVLFEERAILILFEIFYNLNCQQHNKM